MFSALSILEYTFKMDQSSEIICSILTASEQDKERNYI